MKRAALLGGALLLAQACSAAPDYINVTRGGPLRAGFYGRIAVAPDAPPPPVVNAVPTVARGERSAATREPVYLYVPPGQLRRWPQHCQKWAACEQPVHFVRVDDSPSRLGEWKKVQRPLPQASVVMNALDRLSQQP